MVDLSLAEIYLGRIIVDVDGRHSWFIRKIAIFPSLRQAVCMSGGRSSILEFRKQEGSFTLGASHAYRTISL